VGSGGRKKGSRRPDLTLGEEEPSGSPLFPRGEALLRGAAASPAGLALAGDGREMGGRPEGEEEKGEDRTGGPREEEATGVRSGASTGFGLRVAPCNRVRSPFRLFSSKERNERCRWPWLDPR
jgi:hypothetical protein